MLHLWAPCFEQVWFPSGPCLSVRLRNMTWVSWTRVIFWKMARDLPSRIGKRRFD